MKKCSSEEFFNRRRLLIFDDDIGVVGTFASSSRLEGFAVTLLAASGGRGTIKVRWPSLEGTLPDTLENENSCTHR